MENFGRHGKKKFIALIFIILFAIFLVYWYGVWPFSRTVVVSKAQLTSRGVIVEMVPSWQVKAPALFCSFDRDKGRHYTKLNETVGYGGPDVAILNGKAITIEAVFGKSEWREMNEVEFQRLIESKDRIYCRLYQANFSSIESEEFYIALPSKKNRQEK